jgi:pilus assembly protein Flp/PilA
MISRQLLALFLADRRGVTAIEYGMIVGLIGLTIAAGMKLLGTNLSTIFSSLSTSV